MTIDSINKANKIYFIDDFLGIIVDKKDHLIITTNKMGEEVWDDDTEACKNIFNSYTIGDMVIDAPYKVGMIMWKILNNTADFKCKKFVKNFPGKVIFDYD